MRSSSAARSRVLPAAGLAVTALIVAGCGSANGAAKTAAAAPSGSRGGFGSFTAAFGKATAVSSSGVKVTSGATTTVVAWATSTRFTKVVTGSRSAVAVGDCVTVSAAMRAPSGSGSPSPSATSTVKATSVTVTGTSACAARQGFAGRGPGAGGVRPSGAPTTRPTTRPSGAPGRFQRGAGGSGRVGGFGGFGGGAVGTVTGISGSQIVVKTQGFGSTTAASRTVTTTASTTYRVSSTATSGAVSKGQCIAAVGSKASDGTLDAQSITVSTPTGVTCTATGFAGGFGSGGFPGGGPGQQGQSNA
jgi:hypothetical protein